MSYHYYILIGDEFELSLGARRNGCPDSILYCERSVVLQCESSNESIRLTHACILKYVEYSFETAKQMVQLRMQRRLVSWTLNVRLGLKLYPQRSAGYAGIKFWYWRIIDHRSIATGDSPRIYVHSESTTAKLLHNRTNYIIQKEL